MEPINRLNHVIETLRREMARSANRLDSSAAKTTSQTSRQPAAPGRPSVAALRQHIRERINGINPNDPDRTAKAKRAFLESILSWEFGEQMLRDARFDEMVDHVQRAMDAAPEVSEKFSALVADLGRD